MSTQSKRAAALLTAALKDKNLEQVSQVVGIEQTRVEDFLTGAQLPDLEEARALSELAGKALSYEKLMQAIFDDLALPVEHKPKPTPKRESSGTTRAKVQW